MQQKVVKMTSKSTFNAVSAGQISNLQAEAQHMRAEAMANAAVAIGRGIARLFAPLFRVGKWTADSLARQNEVERIYRELSRMTDRDLADIGVSRADIPAIAEGTYRRAAPVVPLRPAAKAEIGEADLRKAA